MAHDIKPPGITDHGIGVSHEPVDRRQLKISQAATLRDLSDEYAWFSLGPLYKYVRLMGRDPWGDFIDETGRDESYQLTLRFTKPVFVGLEIGQDESWNHVLWAMKRDEWEEYCEWMGRLSFVDRDINMVTRLRTQEINIVDPIYLDRCAVLPLDVPTVPVTVFALDTNQGCVFVSHSSSPFAPPHVVETGEVLPDTRAWAQAILTDVADPYLAAAQADDYDPIAELAARVKAAREGQTHES
jgi:hypothetical protein